MNKKWITAALCFCFMLFGMSISGWASSQLQEIKAYLNGELKIRMDGQVVPLQDGNGDEVLPVTYEGTTYLPIRSISQLLDIDVHYDSQAKEVLLGESAQTDTPPQDEGHVTPPNDSVVLVSSSDRTEDDSIIVTGSVQNQAGSGTTAGIVATGFDAAGNALVTKGSSGFIANGSVRNFSVTFDAADIEDVEVKPTGFAKNIELLTKAFRAEDDELIATGVVENGTGSGTTTGIVAIGLDKTGEAVETKGSSGFVSDGSVRNFSVTMDATDIVDVNFQATGFADEVVLLSEASRLVDGKWEVTTAVENGTSNGQTAGIVATGYTSDGKPVETKGSSGFVASGSVRNFSVTLSARSEISYVEIEVTKN